MKAYKAALKTGQTEEDAKVWARHCGQEAADAFLAAARSEVVWPMRPVCLQPASVLVQVDPGTLRHSLGVQEDRVPQHERPPLPPPAASTHRTCQSMIKDMPSKECAYCLLLLRA